MIHACAVKSYAGFGKQAHTYNLFLQVGRYADASSVALTQQLHANRYNAWLSEVYAEGDTGGPFEPFVVGEGRRLTQGLMAYWWEDNPAAASARRSCLPFWAAPSRS
jgi:hypothetical protein